MTNILPGTLSLNEPQIIWAKRKFCTASRPLMIGAKSAHAAPMHRNLIPFLAKFRAMAQNERLVEFGGVNPMLRQKRPIGRPSLFTTELGDEICNRIADGESLRAICAEVETPDKATVFRWLLAEGHKDFSNQYGRARGIQADVLFDEIHQIADTPQKGTKTVRRGEGDNSTVETTEADMIEHRRLQIDARKWLIGKMAPKKYGDKQQIEHAGPDGGPVTLEALIMASLKKE
jgi:hypothetical protein